MSHIATATAACLSVIAFFCGSCSPVGNSAFLRRTKSAANDHIMLVRPNPPTLGFQRLSALSVRHTDLAVFTGIHGNPNFLAETNKGENRYLILYYLAERKAFACRSDSGRSTQVEFSGPYPITESEFQTLSRLSQPGAAARR